MLVAHAMLAQAPELKNTVRPAILPSEQQQIYRSFLAQLPNVQCPDCWQGRKEYLVNSVRAAATVASGSNRCLAGLNLALNPDDGEVFEIPRSVSEGLNISLIPESRYRLLLRKWGKGRRDPAAIIYNPSGIVFTKDHRVAVFRYVLSSQDWNTSGIAVVKFTGNEWQLDVQRTIAQCGSGFVN